MGGTRRPVGVIVPSSNTVVEPELARLAAKVGGVSLHASRLRVVRIGLDAGASAQFEAGAVRAAAELLGDAGVEAVVWAGTSGAWLGPDHDAGIIEALEAATSVRATTTTMATLDACWAYGVERVALLTPYREEVAERIGYQLASQGIEVVSGRHLGMADNRSFAHVSGDQLRAGAVDACENDPQALVVLCTNLQAAPVVGDLEALLGMPVFDSVAVTLWGALRLLGVSLSVVGEGTLLAHGSTRSALSELARDLLLSCAADRVTVRVDAPKLGLDVDITAGEAARVGVGRLGRDRTLDQRGLHTVRWLEEHRRPLVQPDFSARPGPPAALRDRYGVAAQMLGPVEVAGDMVGWVSVHSMEERPWSCADTSALVAAARNVQALVTWFDDHGSAASGP